MLGLSGGRVGVACFLFLLNFKLLRWRLLGLLPCFFPSGKTFFLAGQVERKRRSVKCNKSVLVTWVAELPLERQKPVSTLTRGWVCEITAVTPGELKTDCINVGRKVLLVVSDLFVKDLSVNRKYQATLQSGCETIYCRLTG